MAGLTTTLAALHRYRKALAATTARPDLAELAHAGENPAGLRAYTCLPDSLEPGAGLVVALHGCTETAPQFDLACGWSQLARRHGFALLLPEQVAANNPAGCFNWFRADQQSTTAAEPRTILAMVDTLIARHGLNPRRVYVTGLSAGGAMAAALLCLYPARFAAGAILAGLPFAQAGTLAEGTGLMASGTNLSGARLAEAARRAAGLSGPFPAIQIWQGLLDTVVVPANAEALTRQFLSLHDLPEGPGRLTLTPVARWESWAGRDGRAVVTKILVPRLGHAVPLSLADPDPDHALGVAGPFAQEVGLAAIWQIARGFALLRPQTPPAPAWPFRHGKS